MKEVELSTEDFNALVQLHSTSEEFISYRVSDVPVFLAREEVKPVRCFTLGDTKYIEKENNEF